MSDFVVHFTKPVPLDEIEQPDPPNIAQGTSLGELLEHVRRIREQDRTGYGRWIEILGSRVLMPGTRPLGAARRIAELAESQRVVCFSEIPLDMLDRLVERRSLYGLGFTKEFIVQAGGGPLWYLDDEGEQAGIVRAQIDERVRAGVDPTDPFWKLTPFIDNPGVYWGRPYRFEWEREWRVVGELRFHQRDVAFLFLPEEEHDDARQWFADVEIENSGPAYFCPFVDPRWDMDRIQRALEHIPEKPDPSSHVAPWWEDAF